MAKSFTTTNGTVNIPGAYSSYQVQTSNSGLGTTGILVLVGEAESGPDYTLETDLELNAFGPDQEASVIGKYKSGNLVDAFRAASKSANDTQITGSINKAILVKTNVSGKAQANLGKIGGGTYAVLADKSYSKTGNLIQYQTTQTTAETLPTTSSFTYIPAVGTVAYAIRLNGGAALTGGTLTANTSPTAFVSAIDGLTGIAATGGVDRVILTVSGTLLVAANSNTITLTRSVAWATTPTVGDTLVIPVGSVIAGAADANVGAYVVTGADSTVITAIKLSDAGKGGATPGTITAPVAVSPAATIAAVTDAQAFSPVAIAPETGNVIDGIGKSLEIAELTTGTDLLSRTAYTLGTTTAVTWVSKTSSAKMLSSATEYRVKLADNRSFDGISESFTAGGEIAVNIGYTGTTATATITDTTFATTVVGGSGTGLSLTLTDFPTIQSLVDYVNAQTGYTCSVTTAALGLLPTTYLDNVTAIGICTQFGVKTGRIKIDAYRFYQAITNGSTLVQIGVPAAQAGLPDVMSSVAYLSGGSKGGTTDAIVLASMTALQKVRANIIVPLFSRDASLDITDSLTDIASTYTISSINASVRSHVLAMSTYKKQKNRQAVLSIEDTFANQKTAAANTASFRCLMAFQDQKVQATNGATTQFQPWMGAVLAAGMQAAGFYRNIEYKGINSLGIVHRAGDFDAKDDSQVEEALQAGLLVARQEPTGEFIFLSDQTTYGKDNNFVFNSFQAVYAADIIATTSQQRMQRMMVGQSVADVSASVALTAFETILADFLRLKLIAPSIDAPKGYKNAKVSISANGMTAFAEVKIAGAIDFIDINFYLSAIQQ